MEMNERLKKALSFTIILALCFTLMAAFSTAEAQAAGKTHLKKTSITLTIGATYQQKLLTASGKTISASKVKWSSSNSKIAKISKTGKITAIKTGTVKLKAKYKGKSYTCKVKVIKGVSGKKYYYMSGSKQTQTIDVKWKAGCSDAITADVVDGEGIVGIYDSQVISEDDSDWTIYRLTIRGEKSGTAVIKIIPESTSNYELVARNGIDIKIEVGTLTDSLISLTENKLRTSMFYPDSLTVFGTEVKWIENDRYVRITLDFGGKTDTGQYSRGTYIMDWDSSNGKNWEGTVI